MLRVTGKGGKQRDAALPLVTQALMIILQRAAACAAKTKYSAGACGGVMTPRQRNSVEPLAPRDGLDDGNDAMLCATVLPAIAGRRSDLRHSKLLGHASLSSTQIYTKIDETALLAVYDRAHKRRWTCIFCGAKQCIARGFLCYGSNVDLLRRVPPMTQTAEIVDPKKGNNCCTWCLAAN